MERPLCLRLSCCRQREAERASFAGGRLYPNLAAVLLDDSLAYCQANAGARVFLATVQSLEDHKHLLVVLRGDTDAVIPHREEPLLAVAPAADMNVGPAPVTAELDSVGDQILEKLRQLHRVGQDGGHLIVRDADLGFTDRG